MEPTDDGYEPVPGRACGKCGRVGVVEVRTVESSDGAHGDAHYRCRGCGAEWWIDGADY